MSFVNVITGQSLVVIVTAHVQVCPVFETAEGWFNRPRVLSRISLPRRQPGMDG